MINSKRVEYDYNLTPMNNLFNENFLAEDSCITPEKQRLVPQIQTPSDHDRLSPNKSPLKSPIATSRHAAPLYSPSPSKPRPTIKLLAQTSLDKDKDKVRCSSNSAFKPVNKYKCSL